MAPLLGFAVAGCGAQAYVCQSSAQCNEGVCQPSGYCSFPDTDCESGQRYGEFASSELRGQCVPAEPGTTSSTTADEGTTLPPIEQTSSGGEQGSSEASASTTAVGDGSSSSTSTAGETTTSTGGIEVDPSLIAWWRLDGDPADGAEDSTPNGLDGTCLVCPTSIVGVLDQGFRFTGAEVITIDDPDPFVSETFTITAWIRVTGVGPPTSYHHIVTKPVGVGTRNSWEMFVSNSTTVRLQFLVSNPTQASGATTTLPALDAWVHVGGAYDGTTIRLYVDGELRSEVAGPTNGVGWDDHAAVIGGDSDNEKLSGTFIGDIDDIRVYARALDDTEVASLAGLESPP